MMSHKSSIEKYVVFTVVMMMRWIFLTHLLSLLLENADDTRSTHTEIRSTKNYPNDLYTDKQAETQNTFSVKQ